MTKLNSGSGAPTVGRVLAEWIVGFQLEDAPADVRQESAKAITNSVGTALGGFNLEESQQAFAVAKMDETTGNATLLVDGARVSAAAAAFANGVLFNSLGQEETHASSGTHASEVATPLLLALSEQQHVPGRLMLEGHIVGLEIAMHVGTMHLLPEIKWERCESAAVYGTIGAAAAACKVAGLDVDTTAEALAISANLASGLSECWVAGTPEFHWAVARAAANGYLAMRLAQQGAHASPLTFTGPAGFYHLFGGIDETMNEAEIAEALGAGLGTRWLSLELIYKPWAVHFTGTPFIDGAKILREGHSIDPTEISAIHITMNPFAVANGGLKTGPYVSREDVIGTIPFPVAGMLARGQLLLPDLEDVTARDIMSLVEKTSVVAHDDPAVAIVEVTTERGTFVYDHATDGRDYRLSLDEVVEIYRGAVANVETLLPRDQTEELLDRALQIEREANVGDLIPLMVKAS